MRITRFIIVIAAGVCGVLIAGMLVPALCPWLARESIFEFTAREPKNRNPAEPDAAPKGGPARPSGDLGGTEGSLSVS
jgi:hypothetical protein